ncbi:MAG: hypothetical protein AB8B64_10595 [Granulosicoccus sp.]
MNMIKTQICVRHAVLGVALFLSNVTHVGAIEWEGWSFDFSTNDNSSGLVLNNIEFGGKKILDKVSMPVIRVEYQNDACGPYADILSQSFLQPALQGAPESVCDGLSQCTRTYTQNGEKMLEVGSNWQIGEYQIYQTYYFSENGYFDSRVYSRGLQCLVDHAHHAHWMFDFDLGDPDNDLVVRADGSAPTDEFNDLRSESDGWRIQDKVTGSVVSLIPANDDGEPDDFSNVDVAVRAWRSNEIGRWRLGARGEIGDNYLNGESVDGTDLVLWYVSHLPHSANEGPGIWHASGPRIQVGETTTPPVEPEPPVDPPAPNGDNLLANGGFEAGKAGWLDCGSADDTRAVSVDNNGSQALQITNGGCLYQEVAVMIGTDYTLACDADRTGSNWTIMELSYLDENYEALQSRVAQITTANSSTRYIVGDTVPQGTVRGLALLYSEDVTRFDNCEFIAGTPPIDPEVPDPEDPNGNGTNLLSNGGFEMALGSWTSCAASNLATASNDAAVGSGALALQDGGCLYQEFDASPDISYSMQCKARKVMGNEYTSLTLTLMNEAYAALDRRELAVETSAFADFSATVTAPSSSVRGAVTLYSESPGVFDDCIVVTQ